MNHNVDRVLARGACLLLLAACAGLAPEVRAQSGGVMSRQQLEALLDESGKALENLRAARKQSGLRSLATREDRHGRTFKQDLRENVLLPEAATRLEQLKSTAAADLLRGGRCARLPGTRDHYRFVGLARNGYRRGTDGSGRDVFSRGK